MMEWYSEGGDVAGDEVEDGDGSGCKVGWS